MEEKTKRTYRLSREQLMFIRLYDGNLSEMARTLGVSYTAVARWIKRADIKKAIAERDEALTKSEEIGRRTRAAVEGIGTRILTRQERFAFLTKVILDETNDINSRIKACELLGRANGDFVERLRIENQDDLGEMILQGIEKLKQSAMQENQLMIDEPHGETIDLEMLSEISATEQ